MTHKFTKQLADFTAMKPVKIPVSTYATQLGQAGRLTPTVQDMVAKAIEAQQNHEFIFYIAGPLTGMSEATKDRYVKTSELVASYIKPDARMFGYAPHLHGTDPVKHPDVSPQEVRDIDYLFARVIADAHINFLDPVAHGNAIEEAWAEEAGIPAFYVALRSTTLSRLVRGMNNMVDTFLYDSFETDGLPQIQAFLNELEQHLITAPK